MPRVTAIHALRSHVSPKRNRNHVAVCDRQHNSTRMLLGHTMIHHKMVSRLHRDEIERALLDHTSGEYGLVDDDMRSLNELTRNVKIGFVLSRFETENKEKFEVLTIHANAHERMTVIRPAFGSTLEDADFLDLDLESARQSA